MDSTCLEENKLEQMMLMSNKVDQKGKHSQIIMIWSLKEMDIHAQFEYRSRLHYWVPWEVKLLQEDTLSE